MPLLWKNEVMSIPGRIAFKFRGKKLLLILAALLLAIPCVLAASRNLAFDPGAPTRSLQEPSKEYQAGREAGANEARRREEREREIKQVGVGEPRFKAELAERERREQIELAAKATMQAALVNLA